MRLGPLTGGGRAIDGGLLGSGDLYGDDPRPLMAETIASRVTSDQDNECPIRSRIEATSGHAFALASLPSEQRQSALPVASRGSNRGG